MIIERKEFLEQLINAKAHHLVKIITGIRRCGKSFLLFKLFKKHLIDSGIPQDHIIEINLENPIFKNLRNAILLDKYIRERIIKDNTQTFILIDEIQLVGKVLPPDIDISRVHPEDKENMYVTFHDVLNGLLNEDNVNIYITGSNAKMLSSDIATGFRGRSENIEVTPLSFSEFYPTIENQYEFLEIIRNYFIYGGLPECANLKTIDEKEKYLLNLVQTIYLKDILDRHHLHNDGLLDALTNTAMSMIGSLTNPNKLANAIISSGVYKANSTTVSKYLSYLEDSFLLLHAKRYDVKGKRYLSNTCKYYASDTGIRNARLNFRQNELSHLMENVIYNELRRRGYSVDVGIVEKVSTINNKKARTYYEIDFIATRANEKIYIQSAFNIPDNEKREQETCSLRQINDGFRKIVITGDAYEKTWRDENGIIFMGIKAFLLNTKSLDVL